MPNGAGMPVRAIHVFLAINAINPGRPDKCHSPLQHESDGLCITRINKRHYCFDVERVMTVVQYSGSGLKCVAVRRELLQKCIPNVRILLIVAFQQTAHAD